MFARPFDAGWQMPDLDEPEYRQPPKPEEWFDPEKAKTLPYIPGDREPRFWAEPYKPGSGRVVPFSYGLGGDTTRLGVQPASEGAGQEGGGMQARSWRGSDMPSRSGSARQEALRMQAQMENAYKEPQYKQGWLDENAWKSPEVQNAGTREEREAAINRIIDSPAGEDLRRHYLYNHGNENDADLARQNDVNYILDTMDGTRGQERKFSNNDEEMNGISAAEFKKRHGEAIREKAGELGVDPSVLGGLIITESSGSGFEGGNLKIRLEPSYFNYYTNNKYSDMFMTDSEGRQYFRESADKPWKDIHKNGQESERAAFEVLKKLDPEAAFRSISMGLGQIMGENHEAAGYSSAQEMYNAFSKGHREQLEGTARFIKSNGDMYQAMQPSGDLRTFSRHYNGPGNVDGYTEKLRSNAALYGNLQ